MAIPEFYSVSDVASALGLSKSMLYMLCRRGGVPCLKLGGRYLIPKDKFDRFLADIEENCKELEKAERAVLEAAGYDIE